MSDWKSSVNITRNEAMKVAGTILGLLAGASLLLWGISRLIHRGEPPRPPAVEKPTPTPGPRTGQ